MRVVHVRTGLVLSAAGGLMGRLRPLFKFGLGGRLGSGEQYWPWISLDDEVGAIPGCSSTTPSRDRSTPPGPTR